MIVVIVPMATALAVIAGVVIAYIAIGIAMAVGFVVGLLGQGIGSVLGLFAVKTKLPVADPIWSTTAAVCYFFYYVIRAGIYEVQWNYLSIGMVEALAMKATVATVIVTVAVALIAQVISLTEIIHPSAPLLYPVAFIGSFALNWLEGVPWRLVAIPAVIGLTIYFIVTRPKWEPREFVDDGNNQRPAY